MPARPGPRPGGDLEDRVASAGRPDLDEDREASRGAARLSNPGSESGGGSPGSSSLSPALRSHTLKRTRRARTACRGILLAKTRPFRAGAAADLAHFPPDLGSASRLLDRIPRALRRLQKGPRVVRKNLAIEDPIAVDLRRKLGRSVWRSADLVGATGRSTEAIDTFGGRLLISRPSADPTPRRHAELAAWPRPARPLRGLRARGNWSLGRKSPQGDRLRGPARWALAPGVESYRRD